MNRTDTFLAEVRTTLTDNILPFWLSLKDPRGGFYGEADSSGRIRYDAPRGVILNARLIWSFSAAYRETGEMRYLIAASHATEYFLKNFIDHKYGGVYWALSEKGERLDTKAQLYAQAFAIYALSEFYAVSKDEEALKNAVNLFRIIEKQFADRERGGYLEALSREFRPLDDMSLSEKDINAEKTMNSHLHILEAYANLYRIWPDEGLREAVTSLLDIMTDKIMGPDGHLRLYFDRKWSVLPGGISYGHDIEASWLLLECAMVVRDIDVVNRIKPITRKMALAGLEGYQGDGSMISERHADGEYDTTRVWWVLAECLTANLWLWKYHDDPEGADRAMHTWDYLSSHIIDRRGGEWFWSVDEDGKPDLAQPKASAWKCPYHNTRMCLQVLGLFK